MMPTRMIYPGQVDPPYAGSRWLADLPDAKRHPYALAPQRSIPVSAVETDPFDPSFTTIVLTRRKAWGPAPYVGAPYVYQWWCLIDEHGQGIGGQAWQEYILPFSGYPFTAAELDAALDGYVQRSTAS